MKTEQIYKIAQLQMSCSEGERVECHLDREVRGDEAPVAFALGTEHLLFLTEALEGFWVFMRNSYTAFKHGAIQSDVMRLLPERENEKDERDKQTKRWSKMNTSLVIGDGSEKWLTPLT